MTDGIHIFTRKRRGVDINIWISMIIIMILCLFLLAYKIMAGDTCDMQAISIGHKTGATGTSPFYPDDNISFSVKTGHGQGNSDYTWSFGDGTADQKGGGISHAFKAPGTYVVSATTGKDCKVFCLVKIEAMPQPVQQAEETYILGAEQPVAGQPVNYECTKSGTAYEWSIQDMPSMPVQNSTTATYSFRSEGAHTIQVQVRQQDGSSQHYEKHIIVKERSAPELRPEPPPTGTYSRPREEPREPGKPIPLPVNTRYQELPKTKPANSTGKSSAREISNQELKALLQDAVKGKATPSDFTDFFCSAPPHVRVNEEISLLRFDDFFNSIYNKNKLEITEASIVRDAGSCIYIINVKYKRKKILKIF